MVATLTGHQTYVPGAIVIADNTMGLPVKIKINYDIQGFFLAAIALSILLLCFYLLMYRDSSTETKIESPRESFHDCIVETQTASKLRIDSLSDYINLYNLCNDQIYRDLEYNDFVVRREKFVRQELDERVNLWLVVIITISGVFLSAVQLVMAFRIAVSGKEYWSNDAQFAIKQGEISFKSSVTGLAILALSLAFFVVYVGWIYPNKEVGAPLGAPVPLANGQELPPGGLGFPPRNDADKAAAPTPTISPAK
jgi:RsiW-degrading membrane proteinase PrsW (M82 family)